MGRVPQRFCLRGHDTQIVGREPNHQCVQCRKDRREARRLERLATPRPRGVPARFCYQGHDTAIVGRDAYRACRQCRREREAVRLYGDPAERAIYYEQLPFPELEAWIKSHGVEVKKWHPTTQRAYLRYKARGTTVPLLWADRVACDELGVHPLYIWGISVYLGEAA